MVLKRCNSIVQDLSVSALLTFGARSFFVVVPVHCRMFNIISGP